MLKFIDGPAAGVSLMLRRAPVLLRVTCNAAGKWDGLDQPQDEAEAVEQIYVYQLVEKPAPYHLCIRGKNRRDGGWYWSGTYRFLPDHQPEHRTLCNNAWWGRWCDDHFEELTPEWYKAHAAEVLRSKLEKMAEQDTGEHDGN
jgi:hypothetical protein